MPPTPPQPPKRDQPGPAAPPPPGPPRPQPGSWGWGSGSPVDREVRKAQERAERAARRADRAARRVREAEARAAGRRSGTQQFVDAAGDVGTAVLTAVSAAADEAGARLAAKARQRELEQALLTARAGGSVAVAPPTREEALKLASRVEDGSSVSSVVRAIGLIGAGIAALAMISIGGFGWLGFIIPILFIVIGGQLGERLADADRSRKAGRIQLELARAGLGTSGAAPRTAATVPVAGETARPADTTAATATAIPSLPKLVETGDPRTRAEVVATLDRLATKVQGLLPEEDLATLRRIRDSAAHALPSTDAPLDLADHETWLLRQICIDYLPRALEHYIALPADLASEPVLEGRSARQVLDEQLALIEARLHEMAAREYRREAGGLLNHARFVADSLRPDPFQQRLAELATAELATAEAELATTEAEPAKAVDVAAPAETTTAREHERA